MIKRTPVPLHDITLVALMRSPSLPAEQEKYLAAALENESLFDFALPYNPLKAMLRFAKKHGLASKAIEERIPGFPIIFYDDPTDGSMVAVFDGKTGQLAGGIEGKNVIVRKGYEKLGIGTEMLIKAFENGHFHPDDMNNRNYLSEAGRRLRRSAHREAIKRALENGLDVKPVVLHAYPDLKEEFHEQYQDTLRKIRTARATKRQSEYERMKAKIQAMARDDISLDETVIKSDGPMRFLGPK